MKKTFYLLPYLILLWLPVVRSDLNAQSLNTDLKKDTIRININNEYKISSLSIIPFSEKIFIRSRQLKPADYKINNSQVKFTLAPNLEYSLRDTIYAYFQTVKLNYKKEYKRRDLILMIDKQNSDSIRAMKKISDQLTTESIFGKDLQKSGALVRGFTFGTNRDLQLNSGLRLQLSGKLSDDIDIVAALSDENSPIQAEGNTETLDELDKVFIEIRHKNAIGTFGDYTLDINDNEFSKMTRKLQGLMGQFNVGDTKGTIAIASAKGKFTTNKFNGADGNQGPYRLYGINNENAIVLIAGSERVYIDGELMKRGENNDYSIDYSNAELTFTPKRLITSVSRISIDFEYTDQSFKRNFFGADFSTKIFGDKLSIGLGYFREGDDQNNPIEYTFTDSDMQILRQAGNDRNKATKTGVSLATPDSTGKVVGIYSKVDTLINNQAYTYYKYLPGNSSSLYNVSFTYVGDGNGDYLKQSLGNYSFAGIRQGSYLPLIYIPMPELKQMGNFSLTANIADGINVIGEFSGSSWDKNIFSSVDDGSDFGYARKFQLNVSPRDISIGGLSLGKIGLSLKDRFIQGRFSSLDRIDDVEFSRNYNLPLQNNQDQTLREFELNYFPEKNFIVDSKYGYVKQGDTFSSDRLYSSIDYSDNKSFKFFNQLDYVSSTNLSIQSDWIKENSKVFYSVGLFKPGVDFLYERKIEKVSPDDTLLATSLQYTEAAPFLEYSSRSGLYFKLSYSLREESFPLNGKMTRQSNISSQQYQLGYKGLKEFSTTISIAFRNKEYTEEFRQKGYGDNKTVLILSQSRFNFWDGFIAGDLYYQASTEQTAKLQKVFIKVTKGTGNYIYLGDLNNNGIADENEFQLTAYDGDYIMITLPTDKLYPVIDLKTNTRWKVDFSRLARGNDFWSKVLKPISTETSWRVEENSNDPDTKQIYLMNLSKFLNDSTTITGSQVFLHDFNFWQNSSEFSARLRFNEKKSLNQYSGGTERGYFREEGLRITFRMIEEISNQTELINQTDNMISPPETNRAREVSGSSFSTDFSYRPVHSIETGFKIESAKNTDIHPAVPIIVSTNSLTLHLNFSFENQGRLRIEAERTELTASSGSYNIPFEITKGNVIGKNYFIRASFEYKLNSFIQTSLSYDARLQGDSRMVNTMSAEAKAFF